MRLKDGVIEYKVKCKRKFKPFSSEKRFHLFSVLKRSNQALEALLLCHYHAQMGTTSILISRVKKMSS